MSKNTDDLIERLIADAAPVRRLRPPLIRASLWFFPVVSAVALAAYFFADLDFFIRRASDGKLLTELVATILTGITAAIAAFQLSLPDRSPRWLLLPLAPLAIWIASSGYSCYRQWLAFGADGWYIGDSANCIMFILVASLPLGASIFFLLRRASPLSPLPVAAMGGLAAAAMAAFALQFFHPFDVTFMDLGVHAAAITIVILGMMAAGKANLQRGGNSQR